MAEILRTFLHAHNRSEKTKKLGLKHLHGSVLQKYKSFIGFLLVLVQKVVYTLNVYQVKCCSLVYIFTSKSILTILMAK